MICSCSDRDLSNLVISATAESLALDYSFDLFPAAECWRQCNSTTAFRLVSSCISIVYG